MSLQQTLTSEAAQVAEVAGEQTKAPVVIADPTDLTTTTAAVVAILELLRTQGITSPT
jgi:hypothetical protein